MAVVADVIEEFKQAPPAGKALMIVAIVAVAGAGIYIYRQRNGGSGTQGTLVPISSGDSGSSGSTPSSSGTNSTSSTGTKNPNSNPDNGFVNNKKPKTQPGKTSGQYVTVKSGDTLWSYAQKYYGNGAMWSKISQANNNLDPKKLQVGQRIFIPK